MLKTLNDNFSTLPLLCRKDTGPFKAGQTYSANVTRMRGRKYKPGKENGKWLDLEGEPETRIQIYTQDKIRTFENIAEAEQYFAIV